MNRGIIVGLMLLLASGPLFAHVSAVQGAAHATEHLWLLLALAPALLLLRPLLRHLFRITGD